jgi:hypothetical protein
MYIMNSLIYNLHFVQGIQDSCKGIQIRNLLDFSRSRDQRLPGYEVVSIETQGGGMKPVHFSFSEL